MTFWISHPKTKEPDAMLTLSVYSLAVVLFKFFFSEMSFGSTTFGQLDASTVAALLTPTLSAYVVRKYHDQTNSQKEDKEDVKES